MDTAYKFNMGGCLSEREMDYMIRDTKGKYSDRWAYLQKPGESDKAMCLTANISKGVPYNVCAEPVRIGQIENNLKNPNHNSKQYRVYSPDGKSTTLCGNGGGVGAKTGLYACPVLSEREVDYMFRKEGRVDYGYVQNTNRDKAQCVTANISKGVPYNCLFQKTDGSSYLIGAGQKEIPVYKVQDGMITVKNKQYPIKLADGYYVIRKLTVDECKRLQTVPEDYIMPVSNTQCLRQLGNGWTVDVIAHILSYVPDLDQCDIDVLSMYDGMSCLHIALDKLGAKVGNYYATEIDKYAIQTTMANYPDTIQLGDAFQVRDDDWSLPDE